MNVLLNSDLSATFSPTAAVLVDGERFLLEVELEVTTAARIEVQLQGTAGEVGKPAADWSWFTELSENDNGATTEQAVRTRVIPGAAATLAPGTHRVLLDPGRWRPPLARALFRVATGAVKARVRAVYGLPANA